MKYVVATIAAFVFFHHLVCTALFNSPVNPLTHTYQQYVSNYMDPLFSQKWLLFAPEPATFDLKLWYKIKSNKTNGWSTWLDPLEPILRKHQNMRFTYNAKLLYVYGNIPRNLSAENELLAAKLACDNNDSLCKQRKDKSLVQSSEFKLAKKYVKQDIAKSFPGTSVDSIQIMIIQLYPKQFSERLSSKPFGFASSAEFIPVPFNDAD